jgi:DNA-binding transcriptional regulator LsrR (DeoR family)
MVKGSAPEDLRLMSKIGKLYYEEGLTQDEIVAKTSLSRSKISRLLKQAREKGIVKISVISPPGVYSSLEMELEREFHLEEAVIIESSPQQSQEEISRQIGFAASRYFYQVVKDGDIVGVSWGTTLSYMVAAMHPENLPGAQIVQIIGGLGKPESEVHATALCRRMAQLLSCNLTLLPAPGIVDNQHVKEALQSDSHVQRAYRMFSRLDLAFVGIGAPVPDAVVVRDSSIINQADLAELLALGAVGDIALRFFNREGKPVLSDIDDRVIGIELCELSGVNRVIGVSGGAEKTAALRGALSGGLIDVLITDHLTAGQLLASDPNQEMEVHYAA